MPARRRVREERQEPQHHALNIAQAALRIFRFAAHNVPRILELAHVSAMLRECAVEFGSADAALPGAMRCEWPIGRYWRLQQKALEHEARCAWLARKVLECRDGAPIPALAMNGDVTRHDVNWSAEGARNDLGSRGLTHRGFGLNAEAHATTWIRWAVSPTTMHRGRHWWSVAVTVMGARGWMFIGVSDGNLQRAAYDHPGNGGTHSSGSVYAPAGMHLFGTAPSATTRVQAPQVRRRCLIGVFLDLDANPPRLVVFVDGEPLAAQSPYDFPSEKGPWRWCVGVAEPHTALHSNSV
jgi:hypothetical protein